MEQKQEQISELFDKYADLHITKLTELHQELTEFKVDKTSRSSVKDCLSMLSRKKKEIERVGDEAKREREEQMLQHIHSQLNQLQDKLTTYSSYTEWSTYSIL